MSYMEVSIGGVKVTDAVAKTKSVRADTHFMVLDGVLSFTTYAIRVAGLTKYGVGKFSTAKYEGKYPKENNSSRSQVLFSESEIAFVGSEVVSVSFLGFSVMRGLLNR